MTELPASAVDAVRGLIGAAPGLGAIFGELLDRRERRGRLPATATIDADGASARALAELLSRRAVRELAAGRLRLDLAQGDRVCRAQLGAGLDDLLYAALDRAPRDPAGEDAALRAALVRDLTAAAADCATTAARAFLAAEAAAAGAGSGETYLGAAAGADAAAESARIAACIDAITRNQTSVRIGNFAARVLGDSKGLAAGSDRVRRLGRALLDHHRPTLEAVYAHSGELGDRQAMRLALEVNGVHRDEAALTVHCFGPLVYRKAGDRFDHIARHAALGEPVPLSLAQLRGAALCELPVERALVIENQTPFLDYVEAISRAGAGRELVVFSRGQASWAVVQLLRMVARAGVPIAHSGDLDRSGVLILRSLQDRILAPVTPVAMDLATHRRFRGHGRALPAAERARLAELVSHDPPGAPCRDLLAEILETGLWIEQETFFEPAVIAPIVHDRESTGGI